MIGILIFCVQFSMSMQRRDTETEVSASVKLPSCPSFIEFFDAFSWLTFLTAIMSVVGAIYILTVKVKFNRKRWIKDHHYTLRVILSMLLLLNRLSNTIGFSLSYQLTSIHRCMAMISQEYALFYLPVPWNKQESMEYTYRLYSGAEISMQFLFLNTIYIMMVYLLFLTMDRYKRIHMVLPGSRLFLFMRCHVLLFSLFILIVTFGYAFDTLPYITQQGRYMRMVTYYRAAEIFASIRKVTEGFSLLYGMLLYYYFTIRLILVSVRGVKFSRQALYKAYFSRHSFHSSAQMDSTNGSQPTDEKDMNWAKKQVDIISAQKLSVAIKMIAFFMVVVMTDMGMALVIVLLNALNIPMNTQTYESLVTFVSSWILFHVLVMYQLLDMFLRELKKAKFVVLVETARPNAKIDGKLLRYLNDFDDDDSADDVPGGLLSEFVDLNSGVATTSQASFSRMRSTESRSQGDTPLFPAGSFQAYMGTSIYNNAGKIQ